MMLIVLVQCLYKLSKQKYLLTANVYIHLVSIFDIEY